MLGPMFGEGTFKGSRRKALSGTAGPGEKVREKKNETINIRKTMYLNDLHTFLLFLRQYEKMRKTYIDLFYLSHLMRLFTLGECCRLLEFQGRGFPCSL